MRYFLTLAALVLTTTISLAASPSRLPEEAISLIEQRQNYMKRFFIVAHYGYKEIRKAFPAAKRHGNQISYKSGENETIWQLNHKDQVERIVFHFDLGSKQGIESEKQLLKRYNNKITPDVIGTAPSDTRIFSLKDAKNKLEMDVFLPVADSDPMRVRTLSVVKEARK